MLSITLQLYSLFSFLAAGTLGIATFFAFTRALKFNRISHVAQRYANLPTLNPHEHSHYPNYQIWMPGMIRECQPAVRDLIAALSAIGDLPTGMESLLERRLLHSMIENREVTLSVRLASWAEDAGVALRGPFLVSAVGWICASIGSRMLMDESIVFAVVGVAVVVIGCGVGIFPVFDE